MRETIRWNEGWGFCKGAEKATDVAWECVTLPHTWNAADGQDGGGDYYQGPAWYQKYVKREARWRQVYLRFGAVSKAAEVWCNGTLVGSHAGGFSAFTMELTPYLRDGDNEICVKADNSAELPVYPGYADFTFFGGICRDVELICFTGKAHFDVTRFGTDALLVTPDAADGRVEIRTYATGGERVRARICDADGNCVAERSILVRDGGGPEGGAAEGDVRREACDASEGDAADRDVRGKARDASEGNAAEGGAREIRLELTVPQVHRWNGRIDPYLYRVTVELCDGEQVVDQIGTAFGFREFSVSAEEGFFLNGESCPLHGVCRHQDRENLGWALTEREHLGDMELIREIGANTIRLAHYQQAPFFYDLCDRNGLIVWAEIPFISVYRPEKECDENLRRQLRELILQNYNHPSICIWGLANELGIGGESEPMYEILRELHRTAKELDPGRLTAIANVGMTPMDSPLFHISDVASYNEYMGWYEGSADDHGSFCDERHGQAPEVPIAISEYGADSVLRWHSAEPKVKDYTEEYQAIVHEKAYAAFEKRPYLWATWLWNMFDFAADARDEGGCKGRNNKGLVTYDRSVKKQAFYFYKACWSPEPFVYICGKRFTKRADKTVSIKVYSSQEEVRLWVNGVCRGISGGPRVFEFAEVPLDRQYNEIVARTPSGCTDVLILERVDEAPEEYVYREEKQVSEEVSQWFAALVPAGEEVAHEIVIREGYLSVDEPMEVLYQYPEGRRAVEELIQTPLAATSPAMAERLSGGGGMTFTAIWHHISRMLPDEVYYLLNERLGKIPK